MVIRFTKSEKYEEFLINSAKNATEFLGKESVIFVRKDDLSYAEKIEKATLTEASASLEFVLEEIANA